MAHSKHESVRRRYSFACGYCGVTETDAGGELTVDHFQPRSVEGGDEDDNLVYACFRCNLNKGDFWQTPAKYAQGYHLLHPLNDDVTAHYREDVATHLLEPLSETGALHIRTLKLNRPALVAGRIRRDREAIIEQRKVIAIARIAELRKSIEARESYQKQLAWLNILQDLEQENT